MMENSAIKIGKARLQINQRPLFAATRRIETFSESRYPPGIMAKAKPATATPNSFRAGPDERGHFGLYGGRYVAETLMPLILELEQAYAEAKNDPLFRQQMDGY